MTTKTLHGHLGTQVTIDMCLPCQAIWFDGRESLQLSPGSTLQLFEVIGEQARSERTPITGRPSCPRCGAALKQVSDLQRNTRFRYRACPKRHGRFISFFDFLREKNFIRPLSRRQITELRQNLQAVNCSSCGASIDLVSGSACQHCGAALSMLDMRQAEALVAQLREAKQETPPVDPALPLKLAQARRDAEQSFAQLDQGPRWFDDVSAFGLVGAGLSTVSRWMKQR